MAEDQKEGTEDKESVIISPLRFYLKDASFEAPNSPEIFKAKWNPDIGYELSHTATLLEEGLYEVNLTVTCYAKINDVTVYLAEVQQAGIFQLQGLDKSTLHRVQNVFCLRFLYPYASAALSDLVSKGGFPQLILKPVNFNRLYLKKLDQAIANGELVAAE